MNRPCRYLAFLLSWAACVAAQAGAAPYEAQPTDRSATAFLKRLAAREGMGLSWQLPRDYRIVDADRFNQNARLAAATSLDDAVAHVLRLLNEELPQERPAFACTRAFGHTAVVVVRRETPCPAAP